MPYDETEDQHDEFIADRLAEARADEDDAPGPGPLPPRESRRRDADRKRAERARRRAAGRIEQPMLDTVLVSAVAKLFDEHGVPKLALERGSLRGISLDMGAVFREAGAMLVAKGVTPHSARLMLAERLLGLTERADASR